MRTRTFTAAMAAVFVAIVGVLSLGDRSPGAVHRSWQSFRVIGHEAEVRLGADFIDRADVPFKYDTLGHFVLYAVAGVIAFALLRDRLPVWAITGLVILFSGVVEIAQPLLSATRQMQLSDLTANTVGACVGVGLAVIGTRVLRLVTSRLSRA